MADKKIPGLIEIRRSPIHGEGLFALRVFKADDTICKCTGNIRDRTRISIELNRNEHFDPTGTVEGQINALAKVNHACYPNSYVRYDSKSGFLILKAKKEISINQEITINYCDTETELAHPFFCNCGNHGQKWIDCKHDLKKP